MRTKSVTQMYLNYILPSSPTKVVAAYRRKYGALNDLLLANPAVLDLVHADFCRWLSSSESGRESRYTSEEILRALVVMFVQGDSYRDLVVRIENSEFLRSFIGLGFCKPMMDFSFVAKTFAALSEDTWKAVNLSLAQYAKDESWITGEKLRTDTTAYEANIHYPTDSSLLWDSFRVLSRTLRRVQTELPRLGLKHRYHDRKVKKLGFYIARNAKSTSKATQREVKRKYRTLIERVRWIAEVSKDVQQRLHCACWEAPELELYTPTVERIINQAERRVFHGEVVPAGEKVYSLFEEHTELLVRGKAGKRVEFGHKVLLAQTGEKFISHYRVMPKREEDKDLVDETLDAHQDLFGELPDLFAGDKGFYSGVKKLKELGKKIETVSICKKGRRTAAEEVREHGEAFKDGQRFRAGVEGSISVLKRAFKLNRCLFKGFKNFAASVGCAVFCHNLVLLAQP
ncbi:MAG TPA: ISNCY family transposase [Paracoccaceae bacterium]|nr:ISNCY family transposase [Paracoccaceae bacterium]